MKFSAFAVFAFAAFSLAAPAKNPYEPKALIHKHVPDESKREDVNTLLDNFSSSLLDIIPGEILNAATYNEIVNHVQNIVTTFVKDTDAILRRDGASLESLLSEEDFQRILDDQIEKRAFTIPPAAKALLIKVLKALARNLLKSLLEVSNDTGIDLSMIFPFFEMNAISLEDMD